LQGRVSTADLNLITELAENGRVMSNLSLTVLSGSLSRRIIFVGSRNRASSKFTTKLGYPARIEDEGPADKEWWWKPVWKMPGPIIAKKFLWLALANKLLTRDNGHRGAGLALEGVFSVKRMTRQSFIYVLPVLTLGIFGRRLLRI